MGQACEANPCLFEQGLLACPEASECECVDMAEQDLVGGIDHRLPLGRTPRHNALEVDTQGLGCDGDEHPSVSVGNGPMPALIRLGHIVPFARSSCPGLPRRLSRVAGRVGLIEVGVQLALRQARSDLARGWAEVRGMQRKCISQFPGLATRKCTVPDRCTFDRVDCMAPNPASVLSTVFLPLLTILGGPASPTLEEEPPHWAFAAPQEQPLPQVADSNWVGDDLDRFVLAHLEQRGLLPSQPAPASTWLRRVSFVLTGLPPSPEEAAAFLGDSLEGARERVVDRLLGSERFGEHMASAWLDLARYADTYGYQSDVAREVWPWRDWVIGAFNENLPYDQFVQWQLAGDLLPDPSLDQRLATAFNRLHRQTNEGGSTEEEFRIEYVADRVNTFGTAFMGLSLECARCHDHKSDPISQEDYYALCGFFASIDESGLYSHFTHSVPTPTLHLPTAQQTTAAQLAQDQVLALEQQDPPPLEVDATEFRASFDRTAPLSDLQGHYVMDEASGTALVNQVAEGKPGTLHGANARCEDRHGCATGAVQLTGDDPVSFPAVGHFRRYQAFSLALWVHLPKTYERAVILHRSRAWHDAGSRGYQWLVEDGCFSASLIHFWPGDAMRVRTREPLPAGEWVHLAMSYDGSTRADGIHLFVNGAAVQTEVVRDNLKRSIVGGGEGNLTIGERFRDRGLSGGRVDELVVVARELAPLEVAFLYEPESGQGTDAQWLELQRLASDEPTRAHAEELYKQRGAVSYHVDRMRQIMTMREMETVRPVHRLERGRYDMPREVVDRGVPKVLGSLPKGQRVDRLALARWLTSGEHPLTARVAVNRLWQACFGIGLVSTPEDFGAEGAAPSHPALLDTLAVQFVESGWDTKALMRRIVLSSTFAQSSSAIPASLASDPDGAALSRYPSRRMSAETMRDTALSVSELLVEKMGGPSVKPYQPAGLWKEKSGKVYAADKGEGLYRRSLYTFWKRTSPPPYMMIMDAGARAVCVAKRQPTNTPLQALVMLNDPQRIEAARVLAERILLQDEQDGDRMERLFALLLTRPARPEESELLTEFLGEMRTHYQADGTAASALLAVGASPAGVDADPAELAAWSLVASTLMGFDEAVTIR